MQLHLLKSVYTKKHLLFLFNLKSLNTKNDCNLQDEEMTRILDEKQKLIAEILQVKDKNYNLQKKMNYKMFFFVLKPIQRGAISVFFVYGSCLSLFHLRWAQSLTQSVSLSLTFYL